MTFEQKLVTAVVRGSQLMIEHGLSDWQVKLHSKRTVLADANSRDKVIRYSKHFITVATQEQFDGVTLHEIAHALVGRGHGHDAVFKRKCTEISPNNEYARRSVDINTFKFTLTCEKCGLTGGSNRIKSGLCRKCEVPLTVTESSSVVLAWV